MKLKQLGELAKRIGKNLPMVSYYRYCGGEGLSKDNKEGKGVHIKLAKLLGHGMYGVIVAGAVLLYGSNVAQTDEWSLSKQKEVYALRRLYVERRQDIFDKLFGQNGLVDADKNGEINLTELSDFMDRADMGIEVNPYETTRLNFQSLTTKVLEKTVESYGAKEQTK